MSEKVRVVLVNEADPGNPQILPRNPPGFSDDQQPEYNTENTPDGAEYQALTFKNSGPRTFKFRVTLLPDKDGADKVTEVMRFLFNLVKPTWYTDPRDGIRRFEPPDVTFLYGAMMRRGKVTRRPVTYSNLAAGGVAREIVIDVELTNYVRAVPPAGSSSQQQDYDQFQEQNVKDFLAAEGRSSATTLRSGRITQD